MCEDGAVVAYGSKSREHREVAASRLAPAWTAAARMAECWIRRLRGQTRGAREHQNLGLIHDVAHYLKKPLDRHAVPALAVLRRHPQAIGCPLGGGIPGFGVGGCAQGHAEQENLEESVRGGRPTRETWCFCSGSPNERTAIRRRPETLAARRRTFDCGGAGHDSLASGA